MFTSFAQLGFQLVELRILGFQVGSRGGSTLRPCCLASNRFRGAQLDDGR